MELSRQLTDKAFFRYLAGRKGDTTIMAIAPKLGLSYQALRQRLNGVIEFRLGEIARFKEVYEVSNDEIYKCFFAGVEQWLTEKRGTEE